MSILDNLQIINNADGTQTYTVSAQTTLGGDKNVKVSKSADGQTLIVKVTYKVNLKLFSITRTSTLQYDPSTGMLKFIA